MLAEARQDHTADFRPPAQRLQRSQSAFGGLIQSAGVPLLYPRDVEIFGEGEPAEYFYKVIRGAVRTYRILVDGRRQIGSFNLPGEFFGLGLESTHACSAEAVVDSRILVIRRSAVMAQAEEDMEVARRVWGITGDELKQVRAHVLLLVKTAKERVAAFLLEMAARSPGDLEVELPMCRRDIADYLGLTIETVSRMLADLERQGAIALPNSRRVVLRNRDLLAAHGG